MEIIIAKKSGLCYGVRRALQLVKQTRGQTTGAVFTLGDLIHNPRVIADLEKLGIRSVNDLSKLETGTVIIRSHGVSPEVYTLLEQKNIDIVDATCPIVKKIQKQVAELAESEKQIIIVGSRDHPETKGLIGYTQGKGIIIENEHEAQALPRARRRAVLAQSTQDPHLFQQVVAALTARTEELQVHNTICQFTQTRQKTTSELASCVDTLFIIGGRNSSNTRKLYQISKRIQPNTFFIESAADITPDMLNRAERIGLSGGASTPPEAIQEVVVKLKSNFKHHHLMEKDVQCQS